MSTSELLPPDERATSARQTTAREFLAVVFRRRWIVIGLFVITTATVVLVTVSQKAEYVSSGQVLLKRGEQESVMTPTRRMFGVWEEELGSEVQLIKSYSVLQLAAKKLAEDSTYRGGPTLTIDPRNVDAEAVGKSNVLAIAYADADPKAAQRICDAVISAYIEFREHDLTLAYPSQFFETEIKKVQKELDGWVEQRRTYTNQQGISDIEEQRRGLVSQLTSLKVSRAQEEAGLNEAETMQRQMHTLRDDPSVDLPTFGQLYSNEQALVDLKHRVIEQETRLVTLRERYRDGSTIVLMAQQTLDTLKVMLAAEVESRLKLTDAHVEMVRSRLAVFDRDIAAANDRLARMPDEEARLGDMSRHIELLKTRVEDLTEKSDMARVNERTTTTADLYLIAPAGPAVPRHSRDYVRLALAPAFSLVVGIGLAFFIDGLDLTIHTSGHAEEAVELPMLAAVGERRRRPAR